MSKIAIIGSGFGGLNAGCLLAKKGHHVIIFESHTTPGGYTAGFWRNGFYFESGTLSFESSGQVFSAMKELGVYDRIEFLPQRSRFMGPGYDFIPGGYEQYKQAMAASFPDDKDNLAEYFAALDPMYSAMHKVMAGGSVLSRLSGGLGMVRQYFKFRNTTISDFTAKFFDRNSTLFRIFKSFGYPDMSAWILGGAMATIFDDYWTVKGGMQSLSDVLADRFNSSGGELKLKTRVDKIITRNGAAVGVEANGQHYTADWIVSACDYKKTFLKLLDDPMSVPKQLLEKIKNNSVSEGIVTIYLGLAMSNDELRVHLKIPHVICFDESPGTDLKNADDPQYFEKSSFMVYSPSLHNQDLSPAGKSCVMIQATSPYHWMDNWGRGDKDQYRRLKEQVKQALITKACKVIPDLKKKIEYTDVATPLTYERYTGNTDGATSAWSWNPNNKFYKSTMKAYVETPVKRLLIGSCWATQIGGLPGALSAAQKCAKLID